MFSHKQWQRPAAIKPRLAPRSHSCTRVGAATSAFPLPSSCAKRPGKPGRFARTRRLHHVKNAVPGPQKKPVLLQATGLVANFLSARAAKARSEWLVDPGAQRVNNLAGLVSAGNIEF